MLLLDSQAALWVLDDSPRLGKLARDAVVTADRVYVSAATVWELTIKAMLGKVSVPGALSNRMVDQGLSLLSITAEHAEGLRAFPELTGHDPCDRLIVAQAYLSGLHLVTADSVLLGLGRDFIMDATK